MRTESLLIALCAALLAAGCAATQGIEGPTRVAVHYYPWHAEDFHGRQYLREHLVPPMLPALGEYSDRDPATIAQHLAWSRDAGIGVWIASWWGPDSPTDVTLRESILSRADLGDLAIAIHWETVGRTHDFSDLSEVGPDIDHLAEHVFSHPSCLRIDGRPVIFLYLTRALAHRGMLEATVSQMREAAAAHGHDLYIVGDHAYGPPPDETPEIAALDAITNYDVYSRIGQGVRRYAGQIRVDAHLEEQRTWRSRAQALGVDFIPSVTPGFNDTGVRDGHLPLSRQLDEGAEEGTLFRALLRGALDLTDAGTGHMIAVTSWNEWHEDTQIEPVAPSPTTDRDDSASGFGFTAGLTYDGYGDLYLRILREETSRH